MNNLGNLLEKFKKILSSSRAQKENIIKSIFSATNIKLDPEQIEIKDTVAYVRASPLVRNVLYIKKSLILKDFVAIGGSAITDIK